MIDLRARLSCGDASTGGCLLERLLSVVYHEIQRLDKRAGAADGLGVLLVVPGVGEGSAAEVEVAGPVDRPVAV